MGGETAMASTLIPSEYFLLRRAAAEQLRMAHTMRDLAEAMGDAIQSVTRACDQAKAEVIRSQERVEALRQHGRRELARSLAVLESGDLTHMIAERDRLIAERARRH